MLAYRIADARHPIFDGTGAMLHGGRWNSRGLRALYAAETYAGALLEVLLSGNLSQPPKNHKVIRIEVPDTLKVETVSMLEVPHWNAESMQASRDFGDRWIREGRTAVLRVPSVVTEGRESHFVFNPLHPQFPLIVASEPEPAGWGERLFRRQPRSADPLPGNRGMDLLVDDLVALGKGE